MTKKTTAPAAIDSAINTIRSYCRDNEVRMEFSSKGELLAFEGNSKRPFIDLQEDGLHYSNKSKFFSATYSDNGG